MAGSGAEHGPPAVFRRHSHVLSICFLLSAGVSPHNLCVPSGERQVGAGSAPRGKHLAHGGTVTAGRGSPNSPVCSISSRGQSGCAACGGRGHRKPGSSWLGSNSMSLIIYFVSSRGGQRGHWSPGASQWVLILLTYVSVFSHANSLAVPLLLCSRSQTGAEDSDAGSGVCCRGSIGFSFSPFLS